MLVRDNAYAWGVVDTIVSSVVGTGIRTESATDNDELNIRRDAAFESWAQNCDVNESIDWHSFQSLAQREICEAGEVLVHFVTDQNPRRRVPFALELIEADRLASDIDSMRVMADGSRIVRGIEIDALGKAIAYHVYPQHPDDSVGRQTPVRIPAKEIKHLFRRERVGQSRGVTWFAPVVSWLRDLGIYLENEMVASAVSSCFTAAIKSKSPVSLLNAAANQDAVDANSNTYDNIQPGSIMHLAPDEDIVFGSPGRPNSAAEPWINLILRGIAVGTGLSYETVSRDYSKTNYSSNRASQLEDRRRFRQWQQYLIHQLCEPVWQRFVEAASLADLQDFPTVSELLDDPKNASPAKHLATGWEWVDPVKEQKASEASINANQSTLRDELAKKGLNWKDIITQRAKELEALRDMGLASSASSSTSSGDGVEVPVVDGDVEAGVITDQTLNGAQITASLDVLAKMHAGEIAPDAATELLVAVGLPREAVIPMISSQGSLPAIKEPALPKTNE